MLENARLSVREFLEAMSDENRFFASRALNKSWADLTVMDLIGHYIANTPPSMHIIGYIVEPEAPIRVTEDDQNEHMFV